MPLWGISTTLSKWGISPNGIPSFSFPKTRTHFSGNVNLSFSHNFKNLFWFRDTRPSAKRKIKSKNTEKLGKKAKTLSRQVFLLWIFLCVEGLATLGIFWSFENYLLYHNTVSSLFQPDYTVSIFSHFLEPIRNIIFLNLNDIQPFHCRYGQARIILVF